MKLKKWKLAAAAVCVCFLITAAYAAAAGGADDPLVTLSYLNGVYNGKVQTMVDSTVDKRKAELEQALANVLADPSGVSGSAVFSVVTLSRGQAIVGDVGCEVMLRIGSAACGVPDSETGLIDTTGGTVLGNGGALAVNHLYMVTVSGRTVTVSSSSAKLLVRGPYTIR